MKIDKNYYIKDSLYINPSEHYQNKSYYPSFQEDIDKFAELICQKITKAPSLWYPEWKKRRYADKRYVDES